MRAVATTRRRRSARFFLELVRGITCPHSSIALAGLRLLDGCELPHDSLDQVLLSARNISSWPTSFSRVTFASIPQLGPQHSYSLPKLGTWRLTLHTGLAVSVPSLFLAISGGADVCIHVCEPRRPSSSHRSRCGFNVAHLPLLPNTTVTPSNHMQESIHTTGMWSLWGPITTSTYRSNPLTTLSFTNLDFIFKLKLTKT